MSSYQNGKIYSIRSYQTDRVYIGSTIQPLHKRLYDHKAEYKSYLKGKASYVTSFELIEFDDAYIELVEDYPCNNKYELKRKEGQVMRATANCVNKRIEGRTKKEYLEDNKERFVEYHKEYYQQNKEVKLNYQKQYAQQNREQKREYLKDYNKKNRDKLNEKIMCECGGKCVYRSKARHVKSAKHQNYLKSLQPTPDEVVQV